jgi:hypothetical protein
MEPKTWTVMVYLAADNNLFTFGVDSLRQMKAAAREKINVLAEFDTGPLNRAKRYVFNGESLIGPIAKDVKKVFGPTDAADPDNLASFIEWGAANYPAKHYFVVIWGHGGGVDDDFPRQPDNSFVPRHALLSLFKGTGSDFPKGTGSDFPKGTGSDFPKGTGSDFPKGPFGNGTNRELEAYLSDLIKTPLKNIVDIFDFGEEALHRPVIEALQEGVRHALGEDVLKAVEQMGHDTALSETVFSPEQLKHIEELKTKILEMLKVATPDTLKNENLMFLRRGLLAAVQQGIFDALRTGVLLELQKAVLEAIRQRDCDRAVYQLRDAAVNAILHFLENGMLEVQHSGILNLLQQRTVPARKSLAFVDHPEDFLSNAGLKSALRIATERIGQKIDILGMDSCNMNMIEIGYELRESVNFLVASQDEIPDASWPYDRILQKLTSQPDISPQGLASETVAAFIDAYSDYAPKDVKPGGVAELDEPVSLSALDLDKLQRVVALFCDLVQALRNALRELKGREAIFSARNQIRSFCQNQFIDLIGFCQVLTDPEGNAALARTANPGSGFSVVPAVKQLADAASNLIGPLEDAIVTRGFSRGDENCTGTSIYLPQFDSAQEPHQKRLRALYDKLDFAKVTHWTTFVDDFLNQQKAQFQVAKKLASASGHANGTPSADIVSRLNRAKEATETASKELIDLVGVSKSVDSSVNGTLDGAAQVSKAIALKVESVVTTANGKP